MRQYVEYVGDFLLLELGYPAHYNASNPVSSLHGFAVRYSHVWRQFPFMETSAVGGRTNFFERGVTDYIGAVV